MLVFVSRYSDYLVSTTDTWFSKAGLFSAVLSAFLVESYTALQPDPQTEIIFLLHRIANQNYTLNSGFLNASYPVTASSQFEAPTWALRVNGLWFASLIVSLAAASIGILVKSWLREYLAGEWISPQEKLRARQFRNPALRQWKVFELAAVLPLLLQVSLGLFFIGLCFFTASVDERMALTSIPLVSGWVFFLLMTTIAPILTPRCPFKLPILKPALRQGRTYIVPLALRLVNWILQRRERTFLIPEEEEVVREGQEDVDLLLSIDAILADDSLLATFWMTLKQSSPTPELCVRFVRSLIGHRTGSIIMDTRTSLESYVDLLDLSVLSRRAYDICMNIIGDILKMVPPPYSNPRVQRLAEDAVTLLSWNAPYPLPVDALSTLVDAVTTEDGLLYSFSKCLSQSVHRAEPERSMQFLLSVLRPRVLKEDLLLDADGAYHLASSLDLSVFPEQACASFTEVSAGILRRTTFTYGHAYSDWVCDAVLILLSNSKRPLSCHSLAALESTLSYTADMVGERLLLGIQGGAPFRRISSQLASVSLGVTGSQFDSSTPAFRIYSRILGVQPTPSGTLSTDLMTMLQSDAERLLSDGTMSLVLDDLWKFVSIVLDRQHGARSATLGTEHRLKWAANFAAVAHKTSEASEVLSHYWLSPRSRSRYLFMHAFAPASPMMQIQDPDASWQMFSQQFLLASPEGMYRLFDLKKSLRFNRGANFVVQSSMLSASCSIAEEYSHRLPSQRDVVKDFCPLDMVAFARLHLKLYEELLARAHEGPIHSLVMNGWRSLWPSISQAVHRYWDSEGWNMDPSLVPERRRFDGSVTLLRDHELAQECLCIMDALNQPGIPGATVDTATRQVASKPPPDPTLPTFPSELYVALECFTLPDDSCLHVLSYAMRHDA